MVSDEKKTHKNPGLLELIQRYKQDPLDLFPVHFHHLPKLYIGFNIKFSLFCLKLFTLFIN